jgi:hypothetical protein
MRVFLFEVVLRENKTVGRVVEIDLNLFVFLQTSLGTFWMFRRHFTVESVSE